MLKYLKTTNVGPMPTMELTFGKRLNLITGDNGLGKSFLLDIAWWALTRKWPADVNPMLNSGKKVIPSPQKGTFFHRTEEGKRVFGVKPPPKPVIEFSFTGKTKKEDYRSIYQRQDQAWTGRSGRPANPGLVLYAMVDGSFSVWDPARNCWKTQKGGDVQDRPPAYVFGPTEVWNGLNADDGTSRCNGLIRDWAGWQKENGSTFRNLSAVIKALSPSTAEPLVPGNLRRLSLDDVRDMPTLRMAYGQEVPVVHASAGIRRIVALAYLLVWSWEEHQKASALLEQKTTSQVVFLIDEIEAHLHPKWQRRIVDALLSVMTTLTKKADVQLITATHSPLVLASAEPIFDKAKDAWFDFDFVVDADGKTEVQLSPRTFIRRGDVSSWLTSDAFDLPSARSLEAEAVLKEAEIALKDPAFDAERAKEIDMKLRGVLGDTDTFWMRWRFVAEKKGWLR